METSIIKLIAVIFYYLSFSVPSSTAIETIGSADNYDALSFDTVHKNGKGSYYDVKNYELLDMYQHNVKGEQQQNGFPSKVSSNYPQFGYDHKEYSFYPASIKGGFQFPSDSAQSETSSANTDEINDLKENKEDGFLSKLLIEKPSAIAAIIPLSILLAAVVPGLMNYVASDLNQQMQPVQTIATNKREIRGINGTLDAVLEKIVEFANSTESEENFRKYVCRIAAGEVPFPGSEYIEMATSIIARLVKDDRFKNIDAKYLLAYLKENNCDKKIHYAETTTKNFFTESNFNTANLLNLTIDNVVPHNF